MKKLLKYRKVKIMDFINKIKEQAKKEIKSIILPEPEDVGILKATEIIKKKVLQK